MRRCETCGQPLPDKTGKRGRPNQFCPPKPDQKKSQCTLLAQLLVWMDQTLVEIDFQPRQARETRSALLVMANQSITRPSIPQATQEKREAFGAFVKAGREASGMSSRAFAEACGMDPRRLSAIERGKRPANKVERAALLYMMSKP